MTTLPVPNVTSIADDIARALSEDIGSGDVTAQLVPASQQSAAHVIARESGILAGRAWVEAVFATLSAELSLQWRLNDGDRFLADEVLFTISGPARAILTGERTALNFLQTLSATATITRQYVDAIAGTQTVITDTRKTLPGLRQAQKYAVRCGGGHNHRIGLYDGILIKENHIAAAGGIVQAIIAARRLQAGVPLMTEAETLAEAQAALDADVDLVLVDDFSMDDIKTAVAWTHSHRANGGRTLIEYSGGATLETIRALAETGVDRIAVGALTKHVRAIDLSMRIQH